MRKKGIFLRVGISLAILANTVTAAEMFSTALRRVCAQTTLSIPKRYPLAQVRFCRSIPDGLKMFEFSRKNRAPWLDSTQSKEQKESGFLDISEFCADPERDILYRYQSSSSQEIPQESFPLFKKKVEAFDRCSEQKDLDAVYQSMGLVESYYDLGESLGGITTAGTGFFIDTDVILTAAHNLTLDPKDSSKIKIKNPMRADSVKFFFKHDNGVCEHIIPVAEYKIPKEWEIGRDKKYDFALMFLEKSVIEPRISLSTVKKEMKVPIPTCVAGYPDEVPTPVGVTVKNSPLCSYAHSGELKEISDCRKIIGYDCFTNAGMSGGPVLVKGWPIAIGVHTRGGLDLNRGVHHSEHMEGYLRKWLDDRERSVEEGAEVIEIISELSNSGEEREYLLSNLYKIKAYPKESIRQYISVILDMYRK